MAVLCPTHTITVFPIVRPPLRDEDERPDTFCARLCVPRNNNSTGGIFAVDPCGLCLSVVFIKLKPILMDFSEWHTYGAISGCAGAKNLECFISVAFIPTTGGARIKCREQ